MLQGIHKSHSAEFKTFKKEYEQEQPKRQFAKSFNGKPKFDEHVDEETTTTKSFSNYDKNNLTYENEEKTIYVKNNGSFKKQITKLTKTITKTKKYQKY